MILSKWIILRKRISKKQFCKQMNLLLIWKKKRNEFGFLTESWNNFFALVLLKNRNISIVPEKIVIYPLNKDTYLKKWNPFFMVDITSQRFNYICTAVNLKQLIPILKCLIFREENWFFERAIIDWNRNFMPWNFVARRT